MTRPINAAPLQQYSSYYNLLLNCDPIPRGKAKASVNFEYVLRMYMKTARMTIRFHYKDWIDPYALVNKLQPSFHDSIQLQYH